MREKEPLKSGLSRLKTKDVLVQNVLFKRAFKGKLIHSAQMMFGPARRGGRTAFCKVQRENKGLAEKCPEPSVVTCVPLRARLPADIFGGGAVADATEALPSRPPLPKVVTGKPALRVRQKGSLSLVEQKKATGENRRSLALSSVTSR